MENRVLDILEASVRSYCSQSEVWQAEHAEAMACYELEDYLQVAIELFDRITRFDEKSRTRVFAGIAPHSAELELATQELYRALLRGCQPLGNLIDSFQQRFGQVEFAADFRSKCEEAEGILTPDAEFFGEGLIEVRDAALDSHQRGETFECRS